MLDFLMFLDSKPVAILAFVLMSFGINLYFDGFADGQKHSEIETEILP